MKIEINGRNLALWFIGILVISPIIYVFDLGLNSFNLDVFFEFLAIIGFFMILEVHIYLRKLREVPNLERTKSRGAI